MAKNIVVCSDGTGNTAIKGRGTNVFKLFEAVDLNGHRWDPHLRPQVAFYDDGVGTENFKPLKILGGAAGLGLGRNVRQLYKELARVYDPDDSIYMFGFSRGAFTVRTLVGLIATCGLVDPRHATSASSLDKLVDKAYAAYRQCYRTKLAEMVRGKPTRDAGMVFRQRYSRPERTAIRFLGVWDTVDAVGLPFHLSDIVNSTIYRFKFPDHLLSDSVMQACHAVAIDEERHSFAPLLWDESKNADHLEQVWFAGVHSNVGGGYPKQGMSLVALEWMMRRAEQAGLRFNCRDRDTYRELASVDDKLYDSRAGLGTFYRWKPRDIAALCEQHHMTSIRLHISALERVAHGTEDYAPANLPASARIVFTPPDSGQSPMLIQQRAKNLQRFYDDPVNAPSLLDRLRGAVVLGRLSYYMFLSSCTALLALAAAFTAEEPGLTSAVTSIGSLIGGMMTSPIQTATAVFNALWHHPFVLAVILGGLVLSSLAGRLTKAHIVDEASDFWYRRQASLRDALKGARKSVAASLPSHAPMCWTSRAGLLPTALPPVVGGPALTAEGDEYEVA
jgi:uncharacterized protein (DUF2235 family)